MAESPFLPDVMLVEVLATYLSEIPSGWSDMATAFAILRKLHDVGIELPVGHDDGRISPVCMIPACGCNGDAHA